MKTKVDVVISATQETFKNELQAAIDAIEININNKIVDIKYNIGEEVITALIVYQTKDNERQLLAESNGLDDVMTIID